MKMQTGNTTSQDEQGKTIILLLWQNYHSTVKCRKTVADLQTTGENLQGKDIVLTQSNTWALTKTKEWIRLAVYCIANQLKKTQQQTNKKNPNQKHEKHESSCLPNGYHERLTLIFMNKIPCDIEDMHHCQLTSFAE